MNILTPEQRLQTMHIYYKKNGSVRVSHRALSQIFDRKNRPAESVIRATMDRLGPSLL